MRADCFSLEIIALVIGHHPSRLWHMHNRLVKELFSANGAAGLRPQRRNQGCEAELASLPLQFRHILGADSASGSLRFLSPWRLSDAQSFEVTQLRESKVSISAASRRRTLNLDRITYLHPDLKGFMTVTSSALDRYHSPREGRTRLQALSGFSLLDRGSHADPMEEMS